MIFTAEKKGSSVNIIGKIIEFFKASKDGKYRVVIEPFKKMRSSDYNKYYWMYLRVIEAETGEDAEVLHEFFKRKLLPPRFVNVMGVDMKLPGSTKNLTTYEFYEYILKIERLTGIPAPVKEQIK